MSILSILKKKDDKEKPSVFKKVLSEVNKKPISRIKNVVSKIIKSEPVQRELDKGRAISAMPIKEQVKTQLSRTGNILKEVGQGTARSAGQLHATLTGQKELKPKNEMEAKVQKILFGDRPVKAFGGSVEQTKKDTGLPGIVAAPLVAGSIGLDLFGGGTGKSALSKLAKSTDINLIKNELKSIKGVAQESIEELSPLIAKAKTEKEVIDIIENHKTQAVDKAVDNVDNIPATKKVSPELSGEKAVKSEEALPLPQTLGTPPAPVKFEKFDSYEKDITKFANSKLNLDNLSISDDGRKLLDNVAEEIKPRVEESIGYKLTNKEVLKRAEESSKIIEDTVGRDDTLEWTSNLLKTRQKLATLAETGKVDKELIDTFLAIKTQGTDIARKLQSLSIKADPEKNSAMLTILEAISKTTDDMDAVLKEAEGEDFNNFEQATEFFRKFVKPNIGEWIDLLRYNSMLSSPKTHVVNFFSNLLSTSLMAPIEKTVRGGVDFLGSKLGKRERKYFTGEGGAYLKNYFKSVKTASQKFSNVMKNKDSYTNLDLRDVPLSQKGVKGKIAKVLSVPTKLLEATDQFFMALTEGAETGALKYRKSKGVVVDELKKQAKKDAQYRTYRQELFDENQGPILDAIDTLTGIVQTARKSKNPIVSNVAKFTVPFLQTPMNILKQGVEYSPLGFSTVIGAKNKTEQLSKAIIGSSVFAGAATLLMSDRLTFAEPTGAQQKAQFRAEGKQPYAVKIGNKWVSFQKLPPQISFPLAMVAGIDDAQKNQGLDDSTADLILSSIAKIAQFTSDQSYAKSFGDLIGAVQGGEDAAARLFSNYPQQLIPFRALSGWFARIVDDTQRKIDPDTSFIDKQVQLLMMNIPGLSDEVPARLGPNGRPIENQNRYFNSLSPVSITEQRRVSGGNKSSSKSGGGSGGGGGFSWSK